MFARICQSMLVGLFFLSLVGSGGNWVFAAPIELNGSPNDFVVENGSSSKLIKYDADIESLVVSGVLVKSLGTYTEQLTNYTVAYVTSLEKQISVLAADNVHLAEVLDNLTTTVSLLDTFVKTNVTGSVDDLDTFVKTNIANEFDAITPSSLSKQFFITSNIIQDYQTRVVRLSDNGIFLFLADHVDSSSSGKIEVIKVDDETSHILNITPLYQKFARDFGIAGSGYTVCGNSEGDIYCFKLNNPSDVTSWVEHVITRPVGSLDFGINGHGDVPIAGGSSDSDLEYVFLYHVHSNDHQYIDVYTYDTDLSQYVNSHPSIDIALSGASGTENLYTASRNGMVAYSKYDVTQYLVQVENYFAQHAADDSSRTEYLKDVSYTQVLEFPCPLLWAKFSPNGITLAVKMGLCAGKTTNLQPIYLYRYDEAAGMYVLLPLVYSPQSGAGTTTIDEDYRYHGSSSEFSTYYPSTSNTIRMSFDFSLDGNKFVLGHTWDYRFGDYYEVGCAYRYQYWNGQFSHDYKFEPDLIGHSQRQGTSVATDGTGEAIAIVQESNKAVSLHHIKRTYLGMTADTWAATMV